MISKTDFVNFQKHPCLLWMSKHQEDLLPQISENLRQRFDDGRELEQYAEARYPNLVRGVLPVKVGDVASQYTAAWNEFECRVDLLELDADGFFHLIEVKSSTKPDAYQILDLAFQRTILSKCGLNVQRTSIMHVNSGYIRASNIDPFELLTLTDVTSEVLSIVDIESQMAGALEVANQETMPSPSPRYCHKDFKKDWLAIARGLAGLPEVSVYDLPYLNLLDASALEDLGVLDAKEVPETLLTRKDQRLIWETLRLTAPDIDRPSIAAALQNLAYPLHFLDYESVQLAVPAYAGTRPYQQVVFQYSLHILEKPNAPAIHREYLETSPHLPTKAFSESLRRDIGDYGSVIVWNESFEKTRNKEMGLMLPEFSQFYDNLNSRVYDLMIPFKQGHYRDARCKGSASIKKVLPVLVPSLTYKDLEIQEGQSASRLWRSIVLDGNDIDGRSADILQALREYCKLDTFAMVEIFRALQLAIA